MADPAPIFRPTPRRPFDLTPVSSNSSRPTTPPASSEPNGSPPSGFRPSVKQTPSRTRSVLNLTSSTLFGIYTPGEDFSSPWSTGAQTPSLRAMNDDKDPPVIGAFQQSGLHSSKSHQHHATARGTFIFLALRALLLFLLGLAYGVVVIHLHDDPRLAPVKVEGIERYSRWYLITWGLAGYVLSWLSCPLLNSTNLLLFQRHVSSFIDCAGAEMLTGITTTVQFSAIYYRGWIRSGRGQLEELGIMKLRI